MKRLIILTLTLNLAVQGYSQDIGGSISQIDSIKSSNTSILHSVSSTFNPGRKDLYLDQEWKHGILIIDNDEAVFFNGRINIARGYLEARVNNRIRKIAFGRIKLFELEGKRYIPVKGSSFAGGGPNTFLRVLSWGEIALFERFQVQVESRRGDSLNPGLTGTESLVLESELYYSKDLQTFEELKTNKKFIFSLMSSRQNEIKKMIEINKLKFSSTRDITSIFRYYNNFN